MAREVSSYGFSSVKYIGETSSSDLEQDLRAWATVFKETVETVTSTQELLILDEYQLLSQQGMGLSKELITAYKGALLVVTQLKNQLPTQSIFSDHYLINLSGNIFSDEFDFKLQYFKKVELEVNEGDTFLEIDAFVPENTKLALTVNSILNIMERQFAEYKIISYEALQAIDIVKKKMVTKDNNVNFIIEQFELLFSLPEYQGENGSKVIKALVDFAKLVVKGYEKGVYNTPSFFREEVEALE
ncbi:Uncharacterised protein [Lysinibacillus capsici]|uniref:Uncharacterized protein n=1 Tax=Lysinibacillus capsici TaxID=2115968 RepID=A0A2X1AJ67_9BACI|nr:hypothetical protein [Lysinibacillus capsici]SPU40662.1 Uncharacterised protein [Lysinibacillus capsici]